MHLHEVIWPAKYVLMSFGLWPMRSDASLSRRLFANLRLVLAVLTAMSYLVPEVMTIAVNWGDIDILGDLGSLTVVHTLLTMKLLYYKWRRRDLRSIYEHLKRFWRISDDPEERRHYERPAHVIKVVFIACYVASMCNLLSFGGIALVLSMRTKSEVNETLRRRPLLLDLSYGFDTQRTPVYETVYLWQSLSGFGIISTLTGCDGNMVIFLVHVTAQFRRIAARFRDIGRKIGELTLARHDERELRYEIGKLIAQHRHTIEVAKELSALLSPVTFCQIMSSGLVICLSGYALIEGEGSRTYIVKYLVLLVTLLIQLIAWCVSAELLVQESNAIAEAIYCDVPWFRLTPSLRRDLNFVMMRAQKGCHVSALYQVMSICRITEVVNAAGSYMALLNSMKK